MKMQTLIRLWCLTALVALVTICWPASALVFASDVATINDHASSSKPFCPIQVCDSASSGYDGQSQVEITCDRSAMPVLIYDGPALHFGNQSGNRAVCDRPLFAKFAEFLAAEGTAIPRGFASADQFSLASQELNAALAKSGITDASIGVRGSSVTGVSFRTGQPFGPEAIT